MVNLLFINTNLFTPDVRRGGLFSPEMGAGSRKQKAESRVEETGNGKWETEGRKAGHGHIKKPCRSRVYDAETTVLNTY
jgi:hypothetical protein